MQLNPRAPVMMINLERIEDKEIRAAIRNLIRSLELVYGQVATVANFNLARHISQNAQPTVLDGEAVLWRDADAGAGQPKAYIVAKLGSETFTFKSDQTV